MPAPSTLPFADYAPDLTDIGTRVSSLVSGVLPRGDGYGPFKSFQALAQSLPGVCRGLFFARRSDSSIAVVGATSDRLYLLSNTDFSWTDVSKGGAAYSALPNEDMWQFRQFEDTVIAVQINTAPQAFTLASDTKFSDLGGSPPQASHVSIIGGFLVLSGLSSAPKRVQWSDLFGITTWTAGVGLSDFQDFPDGGRCHSVAGGDLYGIIFQDDRVRRMLYVPGSGAIFDFLVISRTHSILGQYSVVETGDRVFFCSGQGFQMIDASMAITPIGKERVDRTFLADIDTGNLQLFQGTYDPSGTRIIWAYKSGAGQAGLFDKLMVYDWALGRGGRWTVIPQGGEFLAPISKPGLTLENLDAIAPTPLSVTGAADNGSGAIRLTLSALSNADFDIHGQNFITVYGVTGTTEANGSWPFTIIDSTHIDLVGSTFATPYVSGGQIGGSLDKLPFSLDSVSTSSIAQVAIADTDHRVGFFSGPNLEAIIETSEEQNDGDMFFVSTIRPITDCAAGLVSVAFRNVAQGTFTYTAENAIDTAQGQAPCLAEGRYMKARLRCPAGSTWTYALGLQPESQPSGEM